MNPFFYDPFPQPSAQPNPLATRRLQRDFEKILREPIEGIVAAPNDANILDWRYVLKGSPDTPYEGGYYYGKILFQPDFPWKPPAICMVTPNGRFATNTRLCLSISDFHPESWNPGWTVSSILVGLHSFMNEESVAAGVINLPHNVRREYAANSKAWNLACPEFMEMFPNVMDELEPSTSKGYCTSSSDARGSSGREEDLMARVLTTRAPDSGLSSASPHGNPRRGIKRKWSGNEHGAQSAAPTLR